MLPGGEGAAGVAPVAVAFGTFCGRKRTSRGIKFVVDDVQTDRPGHQQVVMTSCYRSVAAVLPTFIVQVFVKT